MSSNDKENKINKVFIKVLGRSVTQSGKFNQGKVVLYSCNRESKVRSPITKWTGDLDTCNQVRLTFRSLESAISYAKKNSFDYILLK